MADAAVAQDDPHPAEARSLEMIAGGVHEVPLDVDRDDLAGPADDVGHEGRVVARPRADLEHALPGRQPELLEHDGHDLGLRGRAHRLTADLLRHYDLTAVHLV